MEERRQANWKSPIYLVSFSNGFALTVSSLNWVIKKKTKQNKTDYLIDEFYTSYLQRQKAQSGLISVATV